MSVLRGLFLLGTFRTRGFDDLPATRQGFLNSLAPLLAFPIVGAGLALVGGAGAQALGDLLGTVVALLAPAVLSHALARRWGREAMWLRYAVAFNWCQWAPPVALLALGLAGGVALQLGIPMPVAGLAVMLAVPAYVVGLHLFLARFGLGIGWGRAVVLSLLVLASNLAVAAMLVFPRMAAMVPA